MPRLQGYRERIHQPFWDSLIRTEGDPDPSIKNGAKLFGNSNVGDLGQTNMTSAGQLTSDQTFVVLAIRCWLFFEGSNKRKNYVQVASQLYWTFIVGQKPQFQAPCWYHPAGGGVWGFDASASVLNLGTPEQPAILKLARPIIVPVRQGFLAQADFFDVGDVSALDLLNNGSSDDQKVIMYMIDGLLTRDVQ
jgi:hypothetical protein